MALRTRGNEWGGRGASKPGVCRRDEYARRPTKEGRLCAGLRARDEHNTGERKEIARDAPD